MKKTISSIRFAWLILLLTSFALIAAAEQIAPPEYQVVDKFGVNVASGQISLTIPTVSIGGDNMGLSHSTSVYTNSLIGKLPGGGPIGLNDKFGGNARYTEVSPQGATFVYYGLNCGSSSECYESVQTGFWLMRVHDHESSADFKIVQNNKAVGYAEYITNNYSYESLRDPRHSLEIPVSDPEYLVWTKPNGTKVWYKRGAGANAADGGYLSKIRYPNGYELEFYQEHTRTIRNVTSNTGYQIKYNYRKFDSNVSMMATTAPDIPEQNMGNWTAMNPSSFVAVNNAYDYCDKDEDKICVSAGTTCPTMYWGQTCSVLTKKWPTAKLEWPLGMPRIMYLGDDTKFKIIDSSQRATEFTVVRQMVARGQHGGPTSYYSYVPRIKSIVDAGSEAVTKTFNYNVPSDRGSFPEEGYLSTITGILGDELYNPGYQVTENPGSFGRHSSKIIVSMRNDLFGAMKSVTNQDGSIEFDENYANRVSVYRPNNGPTEHYFYDSRGNVNKVVYNQGESNSTFIEAEYPSDVECALVAFAFTCNQARWVSDAKGQKTYYVYHQQSGQIESITLPANQSGLKATTHYEYKQYSVDSYYNRDGVQVAGTPIWLLDKQRTCANSTFNTQTKTCALNDIIETKYVYETNNLKLIGVEVTAKNALGALETQRTCYTYDIYGNKIGETLPNANLSSCVALGGA